MNKNDYYLLKLKKLGNSENRIFDREKPGANPKKIHIVGICGTAMGSLAGLLHERGFEVSGSDSAFHSPIKDMLDLLEIKYVEDFAEENISGADVVVIGNVSGPQNPEAISAREQNIPVLSFPEALREFVAGDKERIIISGTHGKTTTTGLVASIFQEAKKDSGYFIGGIIQGEEKSFRTGLGEHFIMEGDEYDTAYFDRRPKMLVYEPTSAIVTSMELDHLDIYSDFTDYKMAFQFLAEDIPENGFFILNADDKNVLDLEHFTKANVVTYGIKDADVTYANLKQGSRLQAFDIIFRGENLGRLETELSGIHNISNICAATTLALQYKIPFSAIFEAVKNFKGMKRRQEVVFENENIIFIDDFAHHPTSVRETLSGLKKKYKGRRIITLFEPRSNSSRKKAFEKDYMKSFGDADVVYLKIPAFRHNDNKEDFMDTEKITEVILGAGKEAHVFETAEEIIDHLIPTIEKSDLVVMMSNGSFDGMRNKLVEKLK